MSYTLLRKIAFEKRKKLENYIFSIHSELDVTGYCAIASYSLWKSIPDSIFVHFENNLLMEHCFIEVKNYIIDITPDQFWGKHRKVLVERKNKYLKRLPSKGTFIYNEEALDFINEYWPDEQKPNEDIPI